MNIKWLFEMGRSEMFWDELLGSYFYIKPDK